ncbi:MAG: hypothetical protein D6767_04330 [Candidatus Hydrogenedentota bacterium]|nr:MAG: hypothetical protein D6767_04330 [Candidatus Hydrogenedentota bacterium]
MKKITLLILFLAMGEVSPAGLKKVLVLDIVQTTPNPNYAYLENTITSAITDMLKKKFAFEQCPRAKWEKILKDNFLFREDIHTRSVGMTLGLLAKQDIVLQGNYHVQESGKHGKKLTLITSIRMMDISKKKVLAEFTESSPVNNTLFTSIEKLAQKTSIAAASVLPNKNKWQKKGSTDEGPSSPVFANPYIRADIGMGLLQGGVANRVQVKPPYLGLRLGASVPIIAQALQLEMRAGWFDSAPIATANPKLSSLTVDTTNLLWNTQIGWKFPILSSFAITAYVGSGILYQMNHVSGSVEDTTSFAIFTPAAGADLLYHFSNSVNLVLSFSALLEMEDSAKTLLAISTLGIQYQWGNLE